MLWGGVTVVALLLVIGIGVIALRQQRQGGPDDSEVSPALLVGRAGQFRGVSIPVPPTGLVLGRESPAQGLLSFAEDSDVSRRHCAIRYEPGLRRFKVTDFDSSNGTFLMPDEKRLGAHEQVLCRPGQLLRLGSDNLFELTLK